MGFVLLLIALSLYGFAVVLVGKRELVALLWLSSWCLVVNVLWLFLVVKWVGLRFAFVVFPGISWSCSLDFSSLVRLGTISK